MLRFASASFAIAIAVAPTTVLAEPVAPGGSAPDPASASTRASAAAAPVYQLPKVGKPRGRIGGGRRGPIAGVAELQALVPDHVGQTTAAQPSLYWYLAEPLAGDAILELTVVDESSIDPLVDRRIAKPAAAGIQRVRLSELGFQLAPGQEVQWSVAVVPDPQDHSKDVVASGWVQRVPPPAELEKRLAGAGADGAVSVYGEAGLWYDMLDAAIERSRANPGVESYREELAALLEQAGLPREAAAQLP